MPRSRRHPSGRSRTAASGSRLALLLATAALAAGCPASAGDAGHHRPTAAAACATPDGIAHRGASAEAPENTMAAFTRAVADRAAGFELDTRWTRDGVPVVMHDATVDRTTDGTGRVADLTAAGFRALDAGHGERPPTLDRPLELAAARRVTVIVELKPVPTEAQTRQILATIHRAGADRQVIVHSFLPAAVDAVHRAARGLRTALTTGRPVSPAEAARHGSVLNVSRTQVTRARVAAWHRSGLRVYAWTADRAADWARLRGAGVDGILTDRIAAYTQWTRAVCS